MGSTPRDGVFFISFIILSFFSSQGLCNAPIELWLDVDASNNVQSAKAIERGIRLALDEVGYQVNGHPIKLVVKNHHGNVLRSLKNYRQFEQ